jgi:Uma2 family endonuclease
MSKNATNLCRVNYTPKYETKFNIYSELSLDLTSGRATPDICLYEASPIDFDRDEIRVKEAPLLAIEILSPRQTIDDIKDKFARIYNPAGVKSVWLVIPQLKIVALGLPNNQFDTLKTDIVKDLYLDIEIALKDIFR